MSSHSAIKPRSVEGCSDGCLSGILSHLQTGSLDFSQSDHLVFGQLSYKSPSPLIAGRSALGSAKLLPFENYGGLSHHINLFIVPRTIG